MIDRDKVINGLNCCTHTDGVECQNCPYRQDDDCVEALNADALAILKEDCHNCKLECLLQKYDELKEKYDALLKEQEVVEPKINEYGEAYCICGENVGIIPSSKNLPSIRSKYCSECGRRMKW